MSTKFQTYNSGVFLGSKSNRSCGSLNTVNGLEVAIKEESDSGYMVGDKWEEITIGFVILF